MGPIMLIMSPPPAPPSMPMMSPPPPKPPPPIMPPRPPLPIMPPRPPPPPPSIMPLIIGPMVCIIMAKRRLPILAFIISSIGAIWVIISPPPPPPPPRPASWALAGAVVSVNSKSSVAAWHTTLSAPVMDLLLACASSAGGGANRTHVSRLTAGGGAFCEKDHIGALRAVAAQRFPHGQRHLVHLRINIGRDFVGQDVDDPDQPRARFSVGDPLNRRAVLFDPLADHRKDQPPTRLVAIDQQFARHRAVGEGHDPDVAVEPRVAHEAWHQPLVRLAEIGNRGPDLVGVRIDRDVLVDGSHGFDPSCRSE